MSTVFKALILAAIIPLLLVLGLFVYKLGSETLDPDIQHWGMFGDYVGGTLGAWYGLLAFLGVLYTVHLQRRQIDILKAQAHIDEMQRLLASIAGDIDARLKEEPSAPTPTMRAQVELRKERFSIYTILAAVGTSALVESELKKALVPHVYEDAIKSLGIDLMEVVVQIDQLAWCLQDYSKAGGTLSIEAYYRRRYSVIVCWIHSIGQLSSPRAEAYFDPGRIAREMAEEDAARKATPSSGAV